MNKTIKTENNSAADSRMSPEEANELFRKMRHKGDQSARTRLITENISFVIPLAVKFKSYGENLDDLIQVGYIGLIKAVDNYDPDRGIKFLTYATHCIVGEIRHYLRDKTDAIKRPRWLKKLSRQVAQYVETFVQNNFRLPTIKEISEELNISEEGIIEILKSKHVISLNQLSDENGEQFYLNKIKTLRYSTFQLPIEDRIILEQSLEKLKFIEKKIIYLFFYKDLTQSQIANNLGLSQKKISRMLRKALDKLKDVINPGKPSTM